MLIDVVIERVDSVPVFAIAVDFEVREEFVELMTVVIVPGAVVKVGVAGGAMGLVATGGRFVLTAK